MLTEWESQTAAVQRELAIAREQMVLYARDLQRAYRAERQRNLQLQAALAALERTCDLTLEALIRTLDAADHETEEHSHRVAELSIQIGRAFGLDENELATLRRGALLHDVGKIGVSRAILHKPGPLTAEEWIEMRRHPVLGYEILRNIPFLETASVIVLQHHERYDGTGYPNGLRGEEIVAGARIFAVADAFDAMTSDRPYRPALSADAAIEEIIVHRERQFDPGAVDAMIKTIGDQIGGRVSSSIACVAK